LQICDVVNMFDSIILPGHFIEKVEETLAIFNFISGDRLFKNNINYIYEGNSSKVFPLWFLPNMFSTVSEWIVANYENQIIA
jgi:hypothetical protein